MSLQVESILKEKGIDYRLIHLSSKGVSFDDVIKYSKDKLNSEEICKTIIVHDKKDVKYAFLIKGNKKIDFSKVKEIIGGKASILSYDDLKKSIGTEPGAVCPLLLDIPLFVDNHVFETDKINFGSGDSLFGLEIQSNDLKKIISFKLVEVE
ncbi:MAG: YbaK/EbsC family protein [Candidatus Pacearchaeota archaeon]|jgi:prolyl-tRNA editing enzyme YbaK/EbsC (Cys-tRNA(Pro) deacylase)